MMTLENLGSTLVSLSVNRGRTAMGRFQTVNTIMRGITALMSVTKSHNIRVVSAKVAILGAGDDAYQRDRRARCAKMTTRAHA
jgi:hypothetical protein